MIPPKDISWMNELPDSSLISGKDAALIFGYKTADSISCQIARGVFPRPMKLIVGKNSTRSYWTAKQIKLEVNRRLQLLLIVDGSVVCKQIK